MVKKRPDANYRNMGAEFDGACWLCGHDVTKYRPMWWAGPWLLHRAHIVHQPRREVRAAVIQACPVCHGLSHGETYAACRDAIRPTVANMLWAKQKHDPEWFDMDWLQKHSIRKLPEPEPPSAEFFLLVGDLYRDR